MSPEFHQEAGESFQAESAFDAAICLFTTLGQISDEGAVHAVVVRVYDALLPGRFFVVETAQRSWVTKNLKYAVYSCRLGVLLASEWSTPRLSETSDGFSTLCRATLS